MTGEAPLVEAAGLSYDCPRTLSGVAAVSKSLACILAVPFILISSCVKVQHEFNQPIHLIVDVNVRVDRQLDDFFAFEQEVAPTTAPVTQPVVPVSASANP
jgi:hypothetical protein